MVTTAEDTYVNYIEQWSTVGKGKLMSTYPLYPINPSIDVSNKYSVLNEIGKDQIYPNPLLPE